MGNIWPRVASAALAIGTLGGQSLVPIAPGAHAQAFLSDQQMADLKSGKDALAFAEVASSGGHPAPGRVLELADALALTPEQRAQIQDIAARMQAKAARLAPAFLAAEERLREAFRLGSPDATTLLGLVRDAEKARGDLRAVHLIAAIEAKPVLAEAQRAKYATLTRQSAAKP